MTSRNSLLTMMTVTLMLSLAAIAQNAPKLTFKYKTIDIKSAEQTQIFGIANSGDMVGTYIDSAGTSHGLLLSKGKATNIDAPNATSGTFCYNMNSKGAIVGYYIGSSGEPQGFLYQNKKFTNVGPAGTSTYALGINDSGNITGFYLDTAGLEHGFLLKGTKYTTLDAPGARALRSFSRRAIRSACRKRQMTSVR